MNTPHTNIEKTTNTKDKQFSLKRKSFLSFFIMHNFSLVDIRTIKDFGRTLLF